MPLLHKNILGKDSHENYLLIDPLPLLLQKLGKIERRKKNPLLYIFMLFLTKMSIFNSEPYSNM